VAKTSLEPFHPAAVAKVAKLASAVLVEIVKRNGPDAAVNPKPFALAPPRADNKGIRFLI
jgi:hypothetical protein